MSKRAICGGVLLSLLALWQVRAGSPGAAFTYDRVDKGLLIFRPMHVPTIGMEWRSGPKTLTHGDVVICRQSNERHAALSKEDGGEIGIYEFVMTCGDRVFVVKGVGFEEN